MTAGSGHPWGGSGGHCWATSGSTEADGVNMLGHEVRSLCMVPCSQPCDTMLLRVTIPGCPLALARIICRSASRDGLLAGAGLAAKGSATCSACTSLRKAAIDGVLCIRASSVLAAACNR